MSSLSKTYADEQKQLLTEILALPGNNVCADCQSPAPRWASWNIGIFLCVHCATVHRKLGSQISKVKSLALDIWTKEQVENMMNIGNVKANALYNPDPLRNPPPTDWEDGEWDSEIDTYIRRKYQYKAFMNREPAKEKSSSSSSSALRSDVPSSSSGRGRNNAGKPPDRTVQTNHAPRPITRRIPSPNPNIQEERVVTPLQDGDVGQFIVRIFPQPICINGRFGDVFMGIHRTVGKVALKRLRIGGIGTEESVIRRFQREADTWRCLEHPHILKFLGTCIHETHLYFVSPFMDNGTLLEHINRYPDVNRVRLLSEAASAIEYLHESSIVHGDIKASNVLISGSHHVLLCDFGLAKGVDAQTSTNLKGAGTVRWQSPELWDGAQKSFKSDVYAFSMTITEVLTGSPPFAHLPIEMAVMMAVYARGERPGKAPMECNGVSYENAWRVAEMCWSQLPAERIPISDAFRRLREDPSLV